MNTLFYKHKADIEAENHFKKSIFKANLQAEKYS